jgi:hypothetical protein
VCLVEWAERLPAEAGFTWRLTLGAEGETDRVIQVSGGES